MLKSENVVIVEGIVGKNLMQALVWKWSGLQIFPTVKIVAPLIMKERTQITFEA